MKPPTWLSRMWWSSRLYPGDDSLIKTPQASGTKSCPIFSSSVRSSRRGTRWVCGTVAHIVAKASTHAASVSLLDDRTYPDRPEHRGALLLLHRDLLVDRAGLGLRAVDRDRDGLLPVRRDRRVEGVEEAVATGAREVVRDLRSTAVRHLELPHRARAFAHDAVVRQGGRDLERAGGGGRRCRHDRRGLRRRGGGRDRVGGGRRHRLLDDRTCRRGRAGATVAAGAPDQIDDRTDDQEAD